MRKLKLLIYSGLFAIPAVAQDYGKMKFGDVSAKDFARTVYSIDSNANAVVITDIGSSKLVANNSGGFSFLFKHYRRVHILNKNGFDMATFSIGLYKDETREEKLEKLKAVTYNLIAGKVTEKKLETKSDVFEEKIDKNRIKKKFTLPDVREGSIIEIEYSKKSDFVEFPEPWEFQGGYPRLWSEYSITVPNFFYYVFLSQGYLRFAAEERKDGFTSFNIRDNTDAFSNSTVQVSAGSAAFRWVVENAPGLQEEGHMYSMNNHIQRIMFQLSEQRPPLEYHQFIESWTQVAGMLMELPDFGLELKNDPGWLGGILAMIPGKGTGPTERAKAIYAYLRDHFFSTGYGSIWMDKSLEETAKSKKGNSAGINLLLTALLRHEGIKAEPVILSTRGNGLTYADYPMLFRFDYVVCRAQLNGKDLYLDASAPGLGFGHLPLHCYNGHARVISPTAPAVYLLADSVVERKQTEVVITGFNNSNCNGTFSQTTGYYESLQMRKKSREKGKETVMKDLENAFVENTKIANWNLHPLDSIEQHLNITAEIEVAAETADIIYFNPWVCGTYKQNPFKAGNRLYPVELPYAIEEVYRFSMSIPTGYVIQELPKETIVKLNNKGDGSFEYNISRSDEKITLTGRISLKKAIYSADEYNRLRDFYNQIIKKQAEQVVFKKKK